MHWKMRVRVWGGGSWRLDVSTLPVMCPMQKL